MSTLKQKAAPQTVDNNVHDVHIISENNRNTPRPSPSTHGVPPERPGGKRLRDRRLAGGDRGSSQLHDRGGHPPLVGAVEVQPVVTVGPEGVQDVEPPQSVSQPLHVVVGELLSAGPR